MSETDLKPCPFCGSPAELERDSDHHGQWFNLGCSRHWGKDPDFTCCAGRLWYTESEGDEGEAIKQWNTRAPQSKQPGLEWRGDSLYFNGRNIGNIYAIGGEDENGITLLSNKGLGSRKTEAEARQALWDAATAWLSPAPGKGVVVDREDAVYCLRALKESFTLTQNKYHEEAFDRLKAALQVENG